MSRSSSKYEKTKGSEIFLLPIFEDNYIFAGRAQGHAGFFAVDPGEAPTLISFLEQKSAPLEAILITHEHSDHIGGVKALIDRYPACKIYGTAGPKGFLPECAANFQEIPAGRFSVAGLEFEMLIGPGHTADHSCYRLISEEFLFCGDTLFGLGCGRVISGTLEQMYETLQKLKQLDGATKLFCAHEYSFRNLGFLRQKGSQFPASYLARESGMPGALAEIEQYLALRMMEEKSTVPLSLEFEKKHNPFFRAASMDEFISIRKLRNQF